MPQSLDVQAQGVHVCFALLTRFSDFRLQIVDALAKPILSRPYVSLYVSDLPKTHCWLPTPRPHPTILDRLLAMRCKDDMPYNVAYTWSDVVLLAMVEKGTLTWDRWATWEWKNLVKP